MYFGHKHVENEPNFSHELAIFLNYHITLMQETYHSSKYVVYVIIT